MPIAPDGGAPPIVGSGDLLIVAPTRVRVVQGFVRCIDVQLRHPDGSTDDVSTSEALSVMASDETVARSVERTSCDGRIGLVGASMGETVATVVLRGDGGELSFPLPVEVRAVAIRARLLETPPIAVGDTRDYPFISFDAVDDAGAIIEWPGGFAPSTWVRLVVEDVSIATAVAAGDDFALHGEQIGTTTMHVAYDGPVSSFTSDVVDLRVVGGGTFMQLVEIRLRDDDGAPRSPFAPVSVSECFSAHLIGRYTLDGTMFDTYDAEVVDEAVWTTDASVLRRASERPARFCADAQGDALLTGCAFGACMGMGIAVVGPDGIDALEAELRDSAPVAPHEPFAFCAPVRIYAVAPDGSRRDVTRSPAATMSVVVPTPVGGETRDEYWQQEHGADGAPIFDATGDPCFRLEGGNRPSGAIVTSTLQARYAGRATVLALDVSFD